MALLFSCSLFCFGCVEHVPPPPSAIEVPDPTRGIVWISVDTLRADHLGVYGYDRDTSPHLDRLAQRGVVFDLAFAHSPSTLISHMSAFTSLLPPEHGVKPPRWTVLSDEIPTLPESFRAAGFRTAGFTEGGYLEGDHGFARGFEDWEDPGFQASTDVETTFERGLDFLRSMRDSGERFFLFLHTYSVHDPYEPPEALRHRFWDGSPPTDAPADATTLERVNAGAREISRRDAAYFASRYDDGIRYFDGVLGRFIEGMEAAGLSNQVTLVLMSDHGEEFLDHGRMLHTQVYPELLRIPLIVVHPDLIHRRVERLASLVDLAPTLLDLAGLDVTSNLPAARGRSLLPDLAGQPSRESGQSVYSEVEYIDSQRSLIGTANGEVWQLVERRPIGDPDGSWISRRVDLDVGSRRVGLRMASYRHPRALRIDWIGRKGAMHLEQRTLLPEWTEMEVRLPEGVERGRLRLSVDGCSVPKELGLGEDPRCLGFMLADPTPLRYDLLRLRVGEYGNLQVSGDLSRHPASFDLLLDLKRQLVSKTWHWLARPASQALGDEERRALEALGYL
ncbi:MAG: sulfatase [Thermoanaerobaculia bacterium]|nr:sulfatase [Thermoanaerobaculia bacterium]